MIILEIIDNMLRVGKEKMICENYYGINEVAVYFEEL